MEGLTGRLDGLDVVGREHPALPSALHRALNDQAQISNEYGPTADKGASSRGLVLSSTGSLLTNVTTRTPPPH